MVDVGSVFLMLLLQLLDVVDHVFQHLVQLFKFVVDLCVQFVVDLCVQSVTFLSDAVEQLLDFRLYWLLVSVNAGLAGFIAGPWV